MLFVLDDMLCACVTAKIEVIYLLFGDVVQSIFVEVKFYRRA